MSSLMRNAIRRINKTNEISSHFGLAIDIDGVLIRGKTVLPGVQESLTILRRNRIPYIFMTNGGGETEETKAKKLTNLFECNIYQNQILLSHTPLKELSTQFGNSRVLIIGSKQSLEVAKHYGFHKALNTSQYLTLNPTAYPFKTYHEDATPSKDPIKAIMVFHDSIDWSADLQVCCDLLMGGHPPGTGNTQTMPVYSTNPDLVFSSDYPAPRFAGGSFVLCLKTLFKERTSNELSVIAYGKPTHKTYKYAEKLLIELNNGIPLEKFYGIGDNPHSDIAGANAAGNYWTSVLVKTGISMGISEMKHKPKMSFNDIHEAISTIVGKEMNKLSGNGVNFQD